MAAKKIEIRIDGAPRSVEAGTYLLAALQAAGVEVPTLCQHKDLTPGGLCRLCLTEVETPAGRRLVTACNYPVQEPLAAFTDTERVRRHRRVLAELYLGRWPNVPAVKRVAALCGVEQSRFHDALTEEAENACILCGMCARACDEFMLQRILDFAGRGTTRHMAMPFGVVDPRCVGCTSCAYVCPTGAIEITDDRNDPADARLVRDHGMRVNAEMATLDAKQCRMREVGTANIVEVMNAYDLLPVHNYRLGSHPEAKKIESNAFKGRFFTQGSADACWHGCSMACAKAVDGFRPRTGPYKDLVVVVDGPEYETAAGCANMGCFDPAFAVEFNFYADTYGLDTISLATCIAFVMEAFEAGVITTEHTGGKVLRFGAADEALELLHEMAAGAGFGVDVGQGIRWLKQKWVREYGADPDFLADIGMEIKGLEYSEYVSKESLAQQAGYSMAVKGPQHDEAWLIFMDMVNNQIPTFEDKAEALYYFPLFRTWFGLMGLCKIVWNDVVPADNRKYAPKQAAKIPDHVLNYWKFFEGVTGIPLDEQTMLDQSARVHNLQRLMSRMFGTGDRRADIPPYRALGPVTREEYESRAERYDKQLRELLGLDPASMTLDQKRAALRAHRRDQYEKVLDAAYERRGWDRDGKPTLARLRELGIDLPQVVALLEDRE